MAPHLRVGSGLSQSSSRQGCFIMMGMMPPMYLLPAEDGSNRHIRGDVRDHLADGWDMLIVAHPPCTRLCNSGVRWLHKPPTGRSLDDDMWREACGSVRMGQGIMRPFGEGLPNCSPPAVRLR
ncbi:hypothetical protein [Paracoccus mutanolyticus]|uniref:hypothetical protein n=1 Tax=Paracoccus mutanolyticus TaxID=1499308 RepID=UPI001CB8B7FB|nr:hypothetical protein [Paracoccus mutanolyticus]